MKKHYTQCLECRKVKTPDGSWDYIELDTFANEISHTYCHDCVEKLKNRLRTLQDFPSWDQPRQLKYLKQDISQSIQVFDKNKLAHYLQEFFGVQGDTLPYYLKELADCIEECVCGFCGKSMSEGEEKFGNFPIHTCCKKILDKKIQVLWDNEWTQSKNLCAYLDMLQIPQHFKEEVTRSIQAPAV